MQMKNHIILFIFILFSIKKLSAQNDTIFVDGNWKQTEKKSAVYYRIKKTDKSIGGCSFGSRKNRMAYTIHYFYLNTNTIQFEGFASDEKGKHLIGDAKWYDENGTLKDSQFFGPKKSLTFNEFPLIFDLNYSLADKSLLTAGIEFCLDCKKDNKLFLGVGYGITNSYNGNYYGLPDLHLSYNTQYLLFFKGGASTKHAYAVSGLTLFNLIDLGFGYSQPFSQNKIPEIKGFTINTTFRFTSQPKKVYTQMRIIQ